MRIHATLLLLSSLVPSIAAAQSNAPVEPVPNVTVTPAASSAPPGVGSEAPSSGAPVVPAVVAPAAPVRAAPPAGPWPPLATWHNDLFYITSPDHNWFIAPTGRLQLDAYVYTGDGVTSEYTTPAGAYRRPDLSDGVVLRRARLETVGGFLNRFTYALGAEFTNAAGPLATDLIFNARIHPLLNFQLGQFDAPFTMENRTSDKYIDFLERSIAVRALGMPTNKEIGLMAWGETPNRLFYYSVGVFNGDGQNRLNRDSYMDVMGRLFAHPFIAMGGLLENVQIGASFHAGWRGSSVDYAYANMATQGGWTFFNSAIATGANPMTIVPDGQQLGIAGEIDIPIRRFDLRGEFIWVQNGTSEMAALSTDAAHLAGPAQRLGQLTGVGYYAQVGYWILGDTGVNGRPGYQNAPSLRIDHADPARLPLGLQVVARFDAVDFRYDSAARTSGTRPAGSADGAYTTYAAEFGVNFWWTRHVRFSLNYMQYIFPNQHVGAGAPTIDENHAHGPHGAASTFGELSARVGLVL